MAISNILSTLKNLIDVSIVWILIYSILKNLKSNIKMIMIFKGVLIIILIKILSDYLKLTTVGLILEYIITWGPLALIIIFHSCKFLFLELMAS